MINLIQSYAHELPEELPQTAFNSAYYSFFVATAMSRSIKVGLASAMLAVTASVIGSLILPLLNQWKGHHDHLSWGVMTAVQLTGLAAMQLLLSFNGYQINLFASAFFTLLSLDLSLSSRDRGFNAKKRGPVFIIA